MGKPLDHHLNPKCIEPVHEKLNKPSFAYIAKLEEIIELNHQHIIRYRMEGNFGSRKIWKIH